MSMKKSKLARMDHDTRSMVMLTKNPVWRAFAKKPMPEKTQTTIGLAGRKALYRLTNDLGRFEDFNELVVTAHAGIVLGERGYGPDLQCEFHTALVTILECRLRALRGECYSLSDREAGVINELLQLHEQQVQLADKAEVASAIVEGYRRAQGS